MTKITVASLAKQLKVKNEDILKCLESLGSFVPNASATMTMDEIKKVCLKLTGKEPRFKSKSDSQDNAKEAAAKEAAAKEAAAKEAAAKEAAAKEAAAKEAAAKEAAAKEAAAKEAAAKEAAAKEAAAKEAAAKEAAAKEAAAKEAAAKAAKAPAPREQRNDRGQARPSGNAPAGQYNRDSRPSNGQRSDRPQGQGYNRGEGRPDRPQGQGYNRGEGRPDRPQGQGYNRGEGRPDRPQGQGYNRGEGRPDRPQGQGYNRGEGRPQGQGFNRGEGRPDRPQGQGYNRGEGRPQGTNGAPRSDRPFDPNRPGANRRPAQRRPGEMDMSEAPKETINVEKNKKNDRVRNKDKDKEKDRLRNNSGENTQFKHKNQNLMQFNEDGDDVVRTHVKKNKPQQPRPQKVEEEIKVVQLPDTMTVREFAEMVHKPIAQIIKSLMMKGKLMGQNDDLDYEQAEELAMEMDILAEPLPEEDIFKAYTDVKDDPDDLETRPPVVVVMGHVDHGKTSLLDAIRNTKVTAGEAGGITQHIGASIVSIDDRKITFLDTPGHEAFTAMRMRGAQVTDIAILVVAADDGIMPQTIEAINHAKAAGVQIIVAINKMDKPEANPERIKQQLTEYELIPEDYGGSTICVPVSARTGEGIETLLEMVLLVADMENYKANPNRAAVGHVIEAQLDKGRGVVATALVQNGTLKIGDSIVVGKAYGKIKAMNDDVGRRVKVAEPSMAVEILGLSEVPVAGEPFYVTANDHDARMLAEKVQARERKKLLEGTRKVSLEGLFDSIQAGTKELNVIVKADVQGSVEAVRQSLEKLSNDQVAIHVVHGAVGAINESDVMLASAANAIIIGFNVRPDNGAKTVAESEKVDVRLYRVIYDAIEDIEDAMKGMLDPEFVEVVQGHAEVRQVIRIPNIGNIAGSYVTDGKISRGSKVRLVRDGIVIYEGELDSLRRFKDDVKEVTVNYECGIGLKDYGDVKEGDVIESFIMEAKNPS